MEEYQNNKIIPYERLKSTGIVYENREKFQDSIYSDIYENAGKLVKGIIEANMQLEEENKKIGCSRTEIEIHNVISFIGRRGTGKTSAMLSFYESILRSSEMECYTGKKGLYFQRENGRKTLFYGIKPIDASALEENEDVFVLVLASMLSNLMGMPRVESAQVREYDNRELLNLFEQIYGNFLTLKREGSEDYEGFSLFERLKNINAGQMLREQFAKLVDRYLDFVSRNNGYGENKFLVIVIDDVDMYKSNVGKEDNRQERGTYEIMRSINQYLSVPGVIVLASYNHVRLYENCKKYFDGNIKENTENEKFQTNDQASQFMEKVFSINSRLYMPSWRKRDFENENWLLIDISDRKKAQGALESFYQEGKKYLTAKQFIFALLGEKTCIFFDPLGLKRHFFEPDTLRTLFNLTDFLIHMDCVPELEKEEFLHNYKRNMKRVKEDFFFRFYEEKLNPGEKLIFERWLEMKIERRAEAIVKDMCQTTHRLGKRAKREEAEFKKLTGEWSEKYLDFFDNRGVEYSYAELIHSIYHMTRDQCGHSRELVACILYSFTLYLTEIYQIYRYHISKVSLEDYKSYWNSPNREMDDKITRYHWSEISKYYKILKGIIGSSVCGKWTEYYYPEVGYDRSLSSKHKIQVVNNIILGYIEDVKKEYTIKYSFGSMEHLEEENKKTKEWIRLQKSKSESNDFPEIVGIIYAYLFISMMQEDILLWNQKNVVCKLTSLSEITFIVGEYYPEYLSRIDFTGFFKQITFYPEFLNKSRELLINGLDAYLTEDINETRVLHVLKEMIDSVYDWIWEEYHKWELDYGNLLLPVYNLDLSYNIVKRMFQEHTRKHPSTIMIYRIDEGSKVFLDEYIKMMKLFVAHLEKIDEFYHLHGKKAFREKFMACPYYTMVDNLKENETGRKCINLYIMGLLDYINDRMEETESPE